MYDFILAFHNILRWIVLFLLLFTVIRALIGWFGKREWTQLDRRLGSFSAIGIDLQLLLGLVLYIFFSPFALEGITNFGFQFVMEQSDYRFFAIEHALFMILAVVFAHVGSLLPRRVEDSAAKYRRAAIWFTLALIVILLGMPWSRPLLPGLS
jgi:hypothetical protein